MDGRKWRLRQSEPLGLEEGRNKARTRVILLLFKEYRIHLSIFLDSGERGDRKKKGE